MQPRNRQKKGKGKESCRASTVGNPHLEPGDLSQQPLASTHNDRSSALASSSGNRFSKAFFDSANGVGITGGTFEQTHGHRNNVTIQFHVNSSTHDQESNAARASVGLPPVQTPSHSVAGDPNPMPSSGQGIPDTVVDHSSKNSNQIYEQQLLLKKRGFPLWIPEPNKRLPMVYQRTGVAIGDVGTYTASGGFSFLFSICLPRDHPYQPDDLPEDFVPIDPPLASRDLREFSEFKVGTYLASETIKAVKSSQPATGLTFETAAAEGAILTIPEGAVSYDLENIPRIRGYAAENIESWYRYVNGPRGREAKNGEVRLVIGCDKTTSWGMAVISGQSHDQHTHQHLKYRPVEDDTTRSVSSSSSISTSSPIPLYQWDYSGFAETRVGPDLEEIELLRRDDISETAVSGKYPNQCLFVRTLNLMLSDDVFATITQELDSALTERWPSLMGTRYNSFNTSPSNTAKSTGGNLSQKGLHMNFGTHRALGLQTCDRKAEWLSMTTSASTQMSHPADTLNRHIFGQAITSRVVITQDEDWFSVIKEEEQNLPNATEIAERVLDAYELVENNGISYLERKRLYSPLGTFIPRAQRHSLTLNRDSPPTTIKESSCLGPNDMPPPYTPYDSVSPMVPTPYPSPVLRTFESTSRSRSLFIPDPLVKPARVLPDHQKVHQEVPRTRRGLWRLFPNFKNTLPLSTVKLLKRPVRGLGVDNFKDPEDISSYFQPHQQVPRKKSIVDIANSTQHVAPPPSTVSSSAPAPTTTTTSSSAPAYPNRLKDSTNDVV